MVSKRRRLDPVGPFGNPDGSRADIEDVLSEFVDFGGNPAYGHLATRANDSMVRVIVGKLGAGKTVYLRRLQDFQSHQDSVYADLPQQSLPKTEVIVKACQWFSDRVLVEKWMQIWDRAIMRSLASHLLRRPELRQQLRDEQADEIEHSYARLLDEFRRPRNIYSQVRDIINQRQTAHQLSTYLDDPLWDDLEDLLGEMIGQCRPIYFYLDAVDEEFSHAPMYWLKCQEGLFYQVMRLLRDPRLGGRLHVVICIRDIVMSSVYRSEHAPRYYNEPHIRVLNWDRGSLLYLLGQKLQRLPPSLLMRRAATGPPSIRDWLGVNGHWPGARRRRNDRGLSARPHPADPARHHLARQRAERGGPAAEAGGERGPATGCAPGGGAALRETVRRLPARPVRQPDLLRPDAGERGAARLLRIVHQHPDLHQRRPGGPSLVRPADRRGPVLPGRPRGPAGSGGSALRAGDRTSPPCSGRTACSAMSTRPGGAGSTPWATSRSSISRRTWPRSSCTRAWCTRWAGSGTCRATMPGRTQGAHQPAHAAAATRPGARAPRHRSDGSRALPEPDPAELSSSPGAKAADYAIGDVLEGRFEILRTSSARAAFPRSTGCAMTSRAKSARSSCSTARRGTRRYAARSAPCGRSTIRNVVEVFWAGKTGDGDWYLIAEFIDGESLDAFASGRKHLRDREAVDVALDLLSALVAFHPDAPRLGSWMRSAATASCRTPSRASGSGCRTKGWSTGTSSRST